MRFCLPYCLAKYRQKSLKCQFFQRHLTTSEISLAKTVFADLIDYNKVKIINYPYIPWQHDDILMAPNGLIFVLDKHYQDDFSKSSLIYQKLFIHEMTHVLQYQQGTCVLYYGALLQSLYYLSFKRYNPYHYVFSKYKYFCDYNIEQQGKIAEDIFLKNILNIILQT